MGSIKDYATGIVATAPSPDATTGTSLILQAGHGSRFPATPFKATAHDVKQVPDTETAEKILVTAIDGDTLTIERAQGDTTAKAIGVGWRFSNAIFVEDLVDLGDDGTVTLTDPDPPVLDEEPTRGALRMRHTNGVGTSTYRLSQTSYDVLEVKRSGDTTGDSPSHVLVDFVSPASAEDESVDSESTLSLTTRAGAPGNKARTLDVYSDDYSRDHGMGMRQLYRNITANPFRFEMHDKSVGNGRFLLNECYAYAGNYYIDYVSSDITGVTPTVGDWLWDNALTAIPDDTRIVNVEAGVPDAGATRLHINRPVMDDSEGVSMRGICVKEIMRMTPDYQMLIRKFIASEASTVAEFGGNVQADGSIHAGGDIATIMMPVTGLTPLLLGGGTLVTATRYFYLVTAVDANGGETLPSIQVQTQTTTTKKRIDLSWDAVDGAVGYRVYRSTTNNSFDSSSLIKSVSTNSYSDTNVDTPTTGQPPITNTAYLRKLSDAHMPGGADVAVADGGTGASTASGARTNLGLGTVAILDSDTDISLTANSDTRIATQKAVKAYIDGLVTGLLDFKGSTDASGNPNYPAASKGDVYVVSVAGKIGGASGKSVDVGDMYLATADNAGGDEASAGTNWAVLEHNLVGALASSNNLSDLANAATARTNLGLAIGTNVQAHDADLDAIAALTPSDDDILQRKSGAWTVRTPSQLKTDLALTKSDVALGSVTNDAQLKAADLDTDDALAANSDAKVPSQNAVKSYVDTGLTTKETTGAWSTWTPTETGFSPAPSGGLYRYRTVGDEIEIEIREPNDGTSNANDFTITLPVTAATIANMEWVGMASTRNAGVYVNNPSLAVISSAGTTLTLYISPNRTTTWGTTGGKRCAYLRMKYRWQ